VASSFKLTIITPEKTFFEGTVVSMVAPCELGYLGVLANHAPLAANTLAGKIRIKKDSGEWVTFYSKGKGFLEVFKNNVTLLLRCVGAQE